MQSSKPDDFFARNTKPRNDARMVHDMYPMRIKTAAERNANDDLFEKQNFRA